MHHYLPCTEKETSGCRLMKLARDRAKVWIILSQTGLEHAGERKGSEMLAFLYPLDPYGFSWSVEIKGS